MIGFRTCFAAAAVLATGLAGAGSALADSNADFYKSKDVTFLVGYSPGGGYDAYTRLIARHLGRHIPGEPNIIAKNMPGAGSLKAANYIYNVAPKDGSVIGMFAGGIVMDSLIGGRNTNFDGRKFTWLGSAMETSSGCWAWHTSGFKTLEDVMKSEMLVGATAGGSSTFAWPTAMNSIVGTKFKVIPGYKGSKGIILAIERGEVQGLCGYFISSIRNVRPDWLKEGKVNMLVQEALQRHPDFPDVPTIMEYAKTKEDKQAFSILFGWQVMGRPVAAPPELSGERTKALREAFWATMHDEKFLADAKKGRLAIEPRDWKQVQAYLDEAWKTPKEVVRKVFVVLGRDKDKAKETKK